MMAFNNPYRVPGVERDFVLPRDFADLDKAWDAYYAALGYTTPVEPAAIPTRPAPTGANEPDPIKKAREDEAIAYLKAYTGNHPFLLDLRARDSWGTKWYRLTERQADAVLKFKANEQKPVKERPQSGRDLTVLPIGRTAAAVTNDEGATTFLLIDRPADLDRFKQSNKWAGWVFVKQFIGGIGEGQRLGSQRPGESYSGQWANLVDRVLEDPEAAVARFGRELGICGVCMLPLTNEESREYGIGPVCRRTLKEARDA